MKDAGPQFTGRQPFLRVFVRGASGLTPSRVTRDCVANKGIFPNAFCKIIPDILGDDPAYCNVMHSDGAGTKSALAYAYWRETGDLSVWKGIAQDALIMNIDDLI